MKLSNVIGLAVSGVLCTGLLGACADGRGTNGFKSYQYSKEERERNLKLREAGKKPADGAKNNATDDTNKGDLGVGTSAPLPPDSGRGTPDPIFADIPAPAEGPGAVGIGDSARPQVHIEAGPQNISGVTAQTASVEKLILTIDEELKLAKEGKENLVAKGLVKGITVLPSGGTNVPRTITIQAIVKIANEEVMFDAADVPVKFASKEKRESVPNFLFTLTKPCEENKPVMVKDLLQAVAFCRDELCTTIQVMLSFKTEGRSANAIYAIQPVRGEDGKSVWAFVATNVGKPKTFQDVQKACEAPKPEVDPATVPAPAPGGVGGGTSTPAPAADAAEKARLEQEKKEREAADAARCEEMKKEGFSCDDSPGEIARIRNNRRAEAERKAREAGAQAQITPFTGDGSEHTPNVPKSAADELIEAEREAVAQAAKAKEKKAADDAAEAQRQADATGGFQ